MRGFLYGRDFEERSFGTVFLRSSYLKRFFEQMFFNNEIDFIQVMASKLNLQFGKFH